jgi:hypothetical protein
MSGAITAPSKVRSTMAATDGATVGPIAGACTHRLVDASPSSGSTVVPYCMCAPVACLIVVSHRAHDDPSRRWWQVISTSSVMNPSKAGSDAQS